MSDITINCFCDERFASVRRAFEKDFALDLELGASFALAIEGELVVDLWAGFATSLAELELGAARDMDRDSFLYKTTDILLADEEVGVNAVFSHPTWRASEANGYGNARSMVKVGSTLANGGSLYGHELLSSATARLAHQEQIYTHDPYFDAPVRYGLGVGLDSKEFPLYFANAMHWGGFGGSVIVMEPDSRACWSYSLNNLDPALAGDARGRRLTRAATACVQALS